MPGAAGDFQLPVGIVVPTDSASALMASVFPEAVLQGNKGDPFDGSKQRVLLECHRVGLKAFCIAAEEHLSCRLPDSRNMSKN